MFIDWKKTHYSKNVDFFQIGIQVYLNFYQISARYFLDARLF